MTKSRVQSPSQGFSRVSRSFRVWVLGLSQHFRLESLANARPFEGKRRFVTLRCCAGGAPAMSFRDTVKWGPVGEASSLGRATRRPVAPSAPTAASWKHMDDRCTQCQAKLAKCLRQACGCGLVAHSGSVSPNRLKLKGCNSDTSSFKIALAWTLLIPRAPADSKGQWQRNATMHRL